MTQPVSLTQKLISDSSPVLVSAIVFAILTTVFGPNLGNFLKAAYIALILVGIWNLLIRKGKDRFSSRLFNTMTVFATGASLAIATSFNVIQGFNAKVTTGKFIADMVLGNLLYTPWKSYLVILLSFLIIYAVFHGIKSKLNR